MNTQQNIIERLYEHGQTCKESSALMKRMLEDIKGVRALLIKVEKYLPPDDEGRQSGEWIDELNETIILAQVKY